MRDRVWQRSLRGAERQNRSGWCQRKPFKTLHVGKPLGTGICGVCDLLLFYIAGGIQAAPLNQRLGAMEGGDELADIRSWRARNRTPFSSAPSSALRNVIYSHTRVAIPA